MHKFRLDLGECGPPSSVLKLRQTRLSRTLLHCHRIERARHARAAFCSSVTMSKGVNSPTARLLQSSRLFSLPRPLPQPAMASNPYDANPTVSDTATTPHPMYQAIATPVSSLSRGDWGLKRPLPGRTTRNTSTPHIRIRAQDNLQHITDFVSAADHTQTLKKWEEMGIRMIHPTTRPQMTKSGRQEPTSVYESWLDHTDPEAAMHRPSQGKDAGRVPARGEAMQADMRAGQRWKYTGPWLAGMQEGEFEAWLAREVTKKQKKMQDWLEFLRKQQLDDKLQNAQRKARDEGQPLTQSDLAQLRLSLRPTDDELTAMQKQLRDDYAVEGLYSDLTALICTFLDLPAVRPAIKDNPSNPFASPQLTRMVNLTTAESDDGPPVTHPGAGLSHIRTNAIMTNHPIHGPQAFPSPVLARVVRPRTTGNARPEYVASLGVGGFVALDRVPATLESNNAYASARSGSEVLSLSPYEPARMSALLDEDLPGGNKMWVQPQMAWVDEQGRVRLDVERADREAVAVKQGEVHQIHEMKRASAGAPSDGAGVGVAGGHRVMRFGQRRPRDAKFGFSLPRRQTSEGEAQGDARRSGIRGFDDSAAERIRQVVEGKTQE